jgi:hypothetical protein
MVADIRWKTVAALQLLREERACGAEWHVHRIRVDRRARRRYVDVMRAAGAWTPVTADRRRERIWKVCYVENPRAP